jgi:hypothetical protein
MTEFNRRRVLRGMLNGGAVTVGLPLLNTFLNGNGNAMADGTPMPVRFGTWFWGLGMSKSIFVPKQTGANYELPEEIESLRPIQKHMNLLTNLTGDIRTVVSYENANTPNSSEVSPLNLYTRLFGADFQNPNAPTFTPSPKVMVRKSALSSVVDEIKDLEKVVGAEDKARLDQYFTGLRHLEQQFDHQLTKPEPRPACVPAAAPKEAPTGNEAQLVRQRHKLMSELLAMAAACDQTRVFNLSWSNASSNTTKPGYDKPHHTCTHEEPKDEKLGYQPNASWFVRRAMESWAYYVKAFSKIKEGDGTLLDNCFIMANTDVAYARVHSLEGMPAFTAGKAGGKIKTGLHVDCKDGQGTSLGFTAMKIMGLDTESWGTKSNQTSKTISEILA